jgi:hypothetical protein
MNTSHPPYDSLEAIILDAHLKIMQVDFRTATNGMIIHLNSGKTIECPINLTPVLQDATNDQLVNYTIIANGTGIHWPLLDEDISLKSLLRMAIEKQII